MRRPPNTATAITTCKGCGATIAKSLAGAPCPRVREITVNLSVNTTKFTAAMTAVGLAISESARNMQALMETFDRPFHSVVQEWAEEAWHVEPGLYAPDANNRATTWSVPVVPSVVDDGAL